MTDQQIIEGNKAIAVFHGWKYIPTPKNKGKGYFTFERWGKACFNPEDLKYHTSWDWLMPVVEKIEMLNVVDEIIIGTTVTTTYYYHIHKEYWNSPNKIDAVWLAVVEFIEWYNKQGKSKPSISSVIERYELLNGTIIANKQ